MVDQQDAAEDIVIAGAGVSGLAVALGLHRKGVRCVVLESSPVLRTSGFAIAAWTNAFRALDALGVGDTIRSKHLQIQGACVMSSTTGQVAREVDLRVQGKWGPHEARCVQRNVLLQALEEELPRGTIRYSSKIVSIDDCDDAKILHLADGSTLRAKGPDGHGFEPKMLQFGGQGFRAGLVPCNRTDVYWFFTWSPSPTPDGKDDAEQNPAEMKQFVLAKLRSIKAPADVLGAVERSEMNDVLVAPLRYRPPLSLLFASICKGNVCVAGDALHPTTLDLAQGACVALEDAVVLARCLGDAIVGKERESVEAALRRYAGIRRWRSAQVIAASYMVGLVQQSDHAVVRFARDRLLFGMLAKGLLIMPDYDCGTL
uniref:3-hydroxybenzoate 6-hydroxylase 1 n=1 Tax=Aegilops tauschii TaxID=37682 RepID=N1QZ40_AEGTA